MSRTATTNIDDETYRRKLGEMATSDLPCAPLYRELYERKYGEEP